MTAGRGDGAAPPAPDGHWEVRFADAASAKGWESRRFVSRHEFAAMSRTAPGIGLGTFRANQDATADNHLDDPYDR